MTSSTDNEIVIPVLEQYIKAFFFFFLCESVSNQQSQMTFEELRTPSVFCFRASDLSEEHNKPNKDDG